MKKFKIITGYNQRKNVTVEELLEVVKEESISLIEIFKKPSENDLINDNEPTEFLELMIWEKLTSYYTITTEEHIKEFLEKFEHLLLVTENPVI